MPYQNIVWIKLEKRLLNDYRFYTMSEKSQLTFVKLLMLAAETHNKLPRNPLLIKTAIRSQLPPEVLAKCLKEIQANFPKFKETSQNYYFYDWNSRHNQIRPKLSPGLALGATGATLEEDKIRKELEEDKKREDTAKLKKEFWENPLISELKAKYPNRNYDLQFDLMCNWWIKNKRKLPKAISAFSNWLDKTKPDPQILADKEAEWQKQKTSNLISPFGRELAEKMGKT